MRIHFVTEKESQRWVLRPLVEALAREILGSTVGTAVDPDASVNFFFNYALYKPVPGITAALFTHRESGVFDLIAQRVDWCFVQSKLYAGALPCDKTTVLPTFPTDPRFYKDKLVLGVVGRRYIGGRKQMEWIEDLRAIQGVEVRATKGKLLRDEMPGFYKGIDYLVVIASNEGGPQPVLEALARCKPIIAPNVGYCWEFPVIRYVTKKDLLDTVRSLVLPKDGWKQSAKIVLEVLQRLVK